MEKYPALEPRMSTGWLAMVMHSGIGIVLAVGLLVGLVSCVTMRNWGWVCASLLWSSGGSKERELCFMMPSPILGWCWGCSKMGLGSNRKNSFLERPSRDGGLGPRGRWGDGVCLHATVAAQGSVETEGGLQCVPAGDLLGDVGLRPSRSIQITTRRTLCGWGSAFLVRFSAPCAAGSGSSRNGSPVAAMAPVSEG